MTTMTVKQLRDLINTIDAEHDSALVIVRVQSDDELLVGGLTSCALDAGCTETIALVLDGDQRAKDPT